MFPIPLRDLIGGNRTVRSGKRALSPAVKAMIERLEDRRLLTVSVVHAHPTARPPHVHNTATVVASVDTEPSIASIPNATIALGSTFSYQVTASGSPAPILSLYSPPAGMQIDSSGLITWTPSVSQLGDSTINVVATNSVDNAERSFSLEVTSPPILNVPATVPATSGTTLSYHVAATAWPTPTFSLVSGPAGMTMDATGLINWPTGSAPVGSSQVVTVSASNSLGTATTTFAVTVVPDTTPPTAPFLSDGPVTSTTAIPLSWTASTDNVGVAGYQVFLYTPAVYKGHSGRGGGITLVSPAKYTLIADAGNATSYTVTGLSPNTIYQYAVAAYDAAGNLSAYSNIVSGTTLLAPSFEWSLYGPDIDPAMSVVANHPLSFLLYTSGDPTPALSMLSAPAGVVLSPGRISWTPTPDEVGVQHITLQAANSVGTYTHAIPVTVTPDTPQISLGINGGITYGAQQYASGQSNYVVNVNPAYGNAGAPQYGMIGMPFNFQVTSATNTNPVTYRLVSGPAGMTLDPNSGAGTWTPTADEAGNTAVQIAAANDAGTSTLELSFPTYSSAAPGTPSATYYVTAPGATTPNPTVTWAPAADVSNVADYLVNVTTAIGNLTTTFDTHSTATSYALPVLAARQYFVTVTPLDAGGHPGLTSNAVSLDEAGLPNVNWTPGQQNAIVGQPATLRFGSTSSGLGLTYTLLSGPAGATIDPSTGLVSWTPTGPGNARIVVAVNAQPQYNWGTVVATVNVPVFFADAPALAVSTDGTATATWSPPTLNAAAVSYYQLQILPAAGGAIVLDMDASGPPSLSLADFGITSGSIQITAVDAGGDVSVASQWVTF